MHKDGLKNESETSQSSFLLPTSSSKSLTLLSSQTPTSTCYLNIPQSDHSASYSNNHKKKSFSGEIFPGRRHSVEKAVETFIKVSSSNRLDVPSFGTPYSRRASLQVESPCRSINNSRILSSGLGSNRRSSPTSLSVLGRAFKRNETVESTWDKRRLSYVTAFTPYHTSRHFNARDVIFDIGADYMKV